MTLNYRQRTVVSALAVSSIVAITGYLSGAVVAAAIFLAIQGCVLGLLLWWTRPTDGLRQISHATAQATAGERDVIVYWMPG